jgi:hypothetical protein
VNQVFMIPKSNNKRGVRRARQNKSSGRGVTIMTPTERFENSLSTNSDAFNLKGKIFLSPSLSTTPSAFQSITPATLGARALALSLIFARYRVNRLIVKFQVLTNSANALIGFLDDSSTGEGDGPSTVAGILEYRCSGVNFSTATTPTYLTWSPTDSSKWYYCTAGASGSDPRLSVAAILYGGVTIAGGSAAVEIDFDITFKGAVDVSST